MLPLRLMGGVHRLVLTGEAPALARFYPSVGGNADPEAPGRRSGTCSREARDRIRDEIEAPVQTNEVARCAGLLGGFLTVAGRTGLPLRVLEIGASAGLNLNWDRYRYESGGRSWGPSSSPVRFSGFVEQGDLPFDVDATVIERRGCDLSPLDPSSEHDRLALRSLVWPDQVERFRMLERGARSGRRRAGDGRARRRRRMGAATASTARARHRDGAVPLAGDALPRRRRARAR